MEAKEKVRLNDGRAAIFFIQLTLVESSVDRMSHVENLSDLSSIMGEAA